MALLWRHTRILTHKNLIITLYRHWLSTSLRTFVLPISLSFIRNFLFPDALYGIGTSRPICSLQQVMAVAGARDCIVFFHGGFIGGDIEKAIANAASQVRNTSLDVITIQQEKDLRTTCVSTLRGTSRCLAATVFHSSPTEGDSGAWNYTIHADEALGADGVHVDTDMNDAQIYTLPLQHTIDFAIGRSNPAVGPLVLSRVVNEYPFTSQTQNQMEDGIRGRYMSMVASALAAPFYLAISCVLYHMTGIMATERDIGMAKLLDTMIPNGSRRQPQIARLISHHAAFDILYAPGWIKTSIIVPILFNLLAGLSTTSLSIFSGAFFRKAQLSGITAIIIALLFALLGQLTAKSGTGLVVDHSHVTELWLLTNYVYFLVTMARFETQNRALAFPQLIFLLFVAYHTFIFFGFGVFVERGLHRIASASHRTVVSGPSPIAVKMERLTKVYQPGFLKRSVVAINGLDLQAHQGEILVLLGANGSDKSTTLDAIAGMSTITSGEVTINYHPWDDLTVSEHVEIFEGIKSINRRGTKAEKDALIKSCGLATKKTSLSKSLSGGQKRKLQIAAMFAGDSMVCCVDEVSSGVDPLSRRILWEILLSQHGLELKNTLGSGYRLHVNRPPGLNADAPYSDTLNSENGHEIVYFPGTLDQDGIVNYQVRGLTLEDVSFKVEEEAMAEISESQDLSALPAFFVRLQPISRRSSCQHAQTNSNSHLETLHPSSQNTLPYLILLSIPIIAAGCSTLFLKNDPYSSCNPTEQISSTSSAQPELSETAMQRITQAPPGSVTMVETLDGYNSAVHQKFGQLMPGGFFLGDKPTMAWRADGPPIFAHIALGVPFQPKTGDQLLFIIIFGLSMPAYPAFLALAMHYSNGVRVIPLWLSYLIFDFGFVLAIIIFGATAASQTVTFLAYFVIFMIVFTFADSSDQISLVDITYYSLALTSPAFSLARALFIASNVFGVAWPILYLVFQSLAMFAISISKDSRSRWGQWWNRRATACEGSDVIEMEAGANFSHATNKRNGLHVVGLQKRWRSNTFVNGVSLIRHWNRARASLGVCPQIDPLENMTVVEHLRFYAHIRGIGDHLQNINALMEAVGIQQFANRIATKLSGGNKRKLSLAIALMGNPSVLILDEPRSLLLTTHLMEEADALASSVGVVATRMLALGTIDELRRRYCGAYYVQIVHRDAPHTSTVEMKLLKRWIKHDLLGAKIDGIMWHGQLRVQILLRIDDIEISLADIFERLETSKASLGVENYSVSVANLD
ncbi:hypothetical protein BCR34DRAFT_629561 [Clohesyomyces aquaticus]|uniref:ABC transporter domain-containing protein n=1 Tax=Clohesyomyces aquaticus TaxID=1231657 RepID=A0A1Y1Y1A4_9PLEO|nr:hypothetical protein BCR34DRAFT_629561 [Clohesyomyces aquaticus]